MVYKLITFEVLKSPTIINGFLKVDRGDFVPPYYSDQAYYDIPLGIGYEQTISQPATVAFMIELLAPKFSEKILDVGSGSGWTTALLGQVVGITGRVIGVERIPELVEFGKNNLSKYNLLWAEIRQAGEELGCRIEAPFDKILVSASANELPQELIKQLKVGGRMIIPIKDSIWQIDKKSDDKYEKKEFPGFIFVPLHQA